VAGREEPAEGTRVIAAAGAPSRLTQRRRRPARCLLTARAAFQTWLLRAGIQLGFDVWVSNLS